jgi:hypothetical protein
MAARAGAFGPLQPGAPGYAPPQPDQPKSTDEDEQA